MGLFDKMFGRGASEAEQQQGAQQRFNDLKRWGLAKSFLTGLGKNFQDKNYVYPIPQGEIDKSGGTITQNQDY